MTQAEYRQPATKEPAVGVLGISYRTAPIATLERLALSADEVTALYRSFADDELIQDALVVSTCNRTEIYTVADAAADPAAAILRHLNGLTGPERVPARDHLYVRRGREGLEHLFRVACGLDSLILGEQQILGQVRDAYEASRAHRAPTAYFDQVVQAAFRVARHSRTQTGIGRGAVSIASAAVHLASRFYSDLSRCVVAVVGAGQTGRLTAEHFLKHAPREVLVFNRSRERAEQLAQAVGGRALPMAQLESAVARADIVAIAVSTVEPLITRSMVQRAVEQRAGRPLVVLDLGLPRNVAADVHDLPGVFLNDIEALQQVVDSNLSRRRQAVPEVESLIAAEVDRFIQRQRALGAGPLIAAMRQAVEQVREAEVHKVSKRLSPAEREAVDRATRAVINKLLHGPMTALKDMARQQEEGAERLELIRQIFSNLDLPGSDR